MNRHKGAFILLLSLIFFAPCVEAKQASRLDSEKLSENDKRELMEVLRLKEKLGNLVWPGLGGFPIPILLFNEKYEFLVGGTDPSFPWQLVQDDDFMGRDYHRRPAVNPQAFAVSIGSQWAGSAGTIELMNSQIPFRLSREFHAVIVLHEVFHAFQAVQAGGNFARAISAYTLEKRYPQNEPEFSAAWNREGEALAGALATRDTAEAASLVQEFLSIRKVRRGERELAPELVAFEQDLEWLEGLAKYAEVRFFELAAARSAEPEYARYRPGHPFWRSDLARLGRNLGGQAGDLRFYLSGAAQALLLDRLHPGWKAEALEKKCLEDLLKAAVLPGSGTAPAAPETGSVEGHEKEPRLR